MSLWSYCKCMQSRRMARARKTNGNDEDIKLPRRNQWNIRFKSSFVDEVGFGMRLDAYTCIEYAEYSFYR